MRHKSLHKKLTSARNLWSFLLCSNSMFVNECLDWFSLDCKCSNCSLISASCNFTFVSSQSLLSRSRESSDCQSKQAVYIIQRFANTMSIEVTFSLSPFLNLRSNKPTRRSSSRKWHTKLLRHLTWVLRHVLDYFNAIQMEIIACNANTKRQIKRMLLPKLTMPSKPPSTASIAASFLSRKTIQTVVVQQTIFRIMKIPANSYKSTASALSSECRINSLMWTQKIGTRFPIFSQQSGQPTALMSFSLNLAFSLVLAYKRSTLILLYK